LKESKPRITWIGVVVIFVVCMVIAGFSKSTVSGDSTNSVLIDERNDFDLIHFDEHFGSFISILRNQDLWQY